jgi:hypothetical protein
MQLQLRIIGTAQQAQSQNGGQSSSQSSSAGVWLSVQFVVSPASENNSSGQGNMLSKTR